MRSLRELQDEAKWKKLPEEEIQYIAERIKASKPGQDDDLDLLIYLLGRSKALQYRKLIEPFLYYPSNPRVSAMAVQILCDNWAFHNFYRKELIAFIQGVSWDPKGEIRRQAISCAGTILRYYPEKELFQILIDLYVDLLSHRENPDWDKHKQLILEFVNSSISYAIDRAWPKNVREPTDLFIVQQAQKVMETLK